jgi:hypothetical protein
MRPAELLVFVNLLLFTASYFIFFITQTLMENNHDPHLAYNFK